MITKNIQCIIVSIVLYIQHVVIISLCILYYQHIPLYLGRVISISRSASIGHVISISLYISRTCYQHIPLYLGHVISISLCIGHVVSISLNMDTFSAYPSTHSTVRRSRTYCHHIPLHSTCCQHIPLHAFNTVGHIVITSLCIYACC